MLYPMFHFHRFPTSLILPRLKTIPRSLQLSPLVPSTLFMPSALQPIVHFPKIDYAPQLHPLYTKIWLQRHSGPTTDRLFVEFRNQTQMNFHNNIQIESELRPQVDGNYPMMNVARLGIRLQCRAGCTDLTFLLGTLLILPMETGTSGGERPVHVKSRNLYRSRGLIRSTRLFFHSL